MALGILKETVNLATVSMSIYSRCIKHNCDNLLVTTKYVTVFSLVYKY